MSEIQNFFSKCEVHGHSMAIHEVIMLIIRKNKLDLSDIKELNLLHADYERRKGVKS